MIPVSDSDTRSSIKVMQQEIQLGCKDSAQPEIGTEQQ